MSRNRGAIDHLARILAMALAIPTFGQTSAAVRASIETSDHHASRSPDSPAPAISTVPEGFEKLTLAPGFLLQMDIYGAPEMSTQLRVNTLGEVTVPLIGAVQISGQTITEAQQTITRSLVDREILRDPQVNLNVLQYPTRNISVLGEVQAPGRVQLLSPEPLSDVLALAGGETTTAGNEIEIRRPNTSSTITTLHLHAPRESDSAAMHNTLVEPGDTVIVHRAGVIYVLGAVNRPGGYLMVNGGALNVVQAISLAGGETPQATTHWATIVRTTAGRIEQIKVPLRKMETGKEPPAELQLNDALYVPASGWKSIVMNGSNVLSAAAAASIYAASSRP